ncbi:MAG TPA: hypothetical protein VMJ10_20055 [Kofleriaceae bacterium]|nr:hypothetical protein [Kofleriaceae bacterium]
MDLRRGVLLVVVVATAGAATVAGGCGGCNAPPGQSYYERNIEPILKQKCSANTSGCHSINADDPYHFAAGNFDVADDAAGTSFQNVQKRRDLLAPFGAYPLPLLLIKAVAPSTLDSSDPNKLQLLYGKTCVGGATPAQSCVQDTDCGTGGMCTPQSLDIDVVHGGGSIIEVDSDAYFTLSTWMANGATEDGQNPATPAQTGNGACSDALPDGFDATAAMPYQSNPQFGYFMSNVQPILSHHGCVSSNCHGAPQSDFYITCGTSPLELAFNFSQAWSFVDTPVDDSQILRIPLAVSAGGRGHTGGDQFASTSDGDYTTIRTWAQNVGVLQFAQDPVTKAIDPNKQFFADNVQPILLRRGCSFEACHSPMATNDFKLRSGTQGFFSAISLQKNYDLLRQQFLALEFPDPRRGRAGAKTVLQQDYRSTTIGGIPHRGGSVLETPDYGPSEPAACATMQDHATLTAWNAKGSCSVTTATQCLADSDCPTNQTCNITPPFCNLAEWIHLERETLATATPPVVTPMESGDTVNIVYVQRGLNDSADRLQFDTFQGSADVDLIAQPATFGANFGGKLAPSGAGQSLLGSCGLGNAPDIGQPDVAPDGDTVAFAGRASASVGWSIYTVSITNPGNCAQLNTMPPSTTIDDFDPAWSLDGNWIVFASTRGKSGPTVSRKRMLPQSDLWRIAVKSDATQMPPVVAGTLQQMTVLSNSEIRPHFMREGRVTMTTEKVSDMFYQLSGRRLNWDLTDYHPLLAQRNISPYASLTDLTQTKPSIGFDAATDIREANDGDFMVILSDVDATSGVPVHGAGAGALALFNRSIGPFEMGRSDPGFLQSVHVIGDPNANGSSTATAGYRSPFYMPDGHIMVSYTNNLSTFEWQIVTVDPTTGLQDATPLITVPGKAAVDAVIAYKSPWSALKSSTEPFRQLYLNRRQLVFGGSVDASDTSHATLYMPDAPMVFTLLTGNLRRGRPVQDFRAASKIAVYTEGMCPSSGCTANLDGIYQNRMSLGTADLASDGSVRLKLPAQTGVVLELQKSDGTPVVTMREEHQLGPGEQISMGVQQSLSDAVCGGCHGSVSGSELDIAVTADALTGASVSASQTATPVQLGN